MKNYDDTEQRHRSRDRGPSWGQREAAAHPFLNPNPNSGPVPSAWIPPAGPFNRKRSCFGIRQAPGLSTGNPRSVSRFCGRLPLQGLNQIVNVLNIFLT